MNSFELIKSKCQICKKVSYFNIGKVKACQECTDKVFGPIMFDSHRYTGMSLSDIADSTMRRGGIRNTVDEAMARNTERLETQLDRIFFTRTDIYQSDPIPPLEARNVISPEAAARQAEQVADNALEGLRREIARRANVDRWFHGQVGRRRRIEENQTGTLYELGAESDTTDQPAPEGGGNHNIT